MSRRVKLAMAAVIRDLLSLPDDELRREIARGGEMARMLIESGLLARLGKDYPVSDKAAPRRRSLWRRRASH
jgi:hypothetical protein